MKRTKKNNKGFSLVELIVVVLIMAIIAVALAPQVMKWVGESRISTDIQMYDGLVSDLQTALTDSAAWTEQTANTTDVTLTINGSGAAFAGGTSTALATALSEVNANYASTKVKVSGASYVITIQKGTGAVVRTTPPVSSEAE